MSLYYLKINSLKIESELCQIIPNLKGQYLLGPYNCKRSERIPVAKFMKQKSLLPFGANNILV